jgi:hypothetical protein
MNNISKKLIKIHEAKVLELKSENVELGMLEDISKQTSELKAMLKEFDVKGKEANKALENAKALYKQRLGADKKLSVAQKALIKLEDRETKISSKVDKLYGQIEKAASSLGVKKQDVKGYKEWDTADKELVKVSAKYNSGNYNVKTEYK